MGNIFKLQRSKAPGLILAYPMSEGSGTTVYNVAGATSDGTLTNGPVWSGGAFGNCLSFDGSNDYINAGSNAALDPTDMTIVCWVMITTTPSNYGNIFERNGNSGYRCRIDNTTNTVTFYFNSTGLKGITSTGTVTLGQWTQIVVTCDSVNGTALWVNGKNEGTNANAYIASNTTGTQLNVGASTTNSEYFNGYIADFKMYNRILSQAEILLDKHDPYYIYRKPDNRWMKATTVVPFNGWFFEWKYWQ